MTSSLSWMQWKAYEGKDPRLMEADMSMWTVFSLYTTSFSNPSIPFVISLSSLYIYRVAKVGLHLFVYLLPLPGSGSYSLWRGAQSFFEILNSDSPIWAHSEPYSYQVTRVPFLSNVYGDLSKGCESLHVLTAQMYTILLHTHNVPFLVFLTCVMLL